MGFNNPALRLFNLLTELKQGNRKLPTSVVLAGVFNVQPHPKVLFHAIVEFHDLVDEVVKFSTHKTNLPSAPLLRYIPQIQSAVGFTNLDAAWENYASRITTECLVVLEMVAHVEGIRQDEVPPTEAVQELTAELDRLFEFVMSNAGLDKEFRTFVLQQIELIRRCLSEFRISGPQGFVRYLETLMVHTGRHAEAIKREQLRNPEAVSMLKTVLVGVKKFVALTESGVSLLKRAKSVHADGARLLEDLTSGGEGTTPELGMTESV